MSQINLNQITGATGEYPFLNILKSAGTWKYVSNNLRVDPSSLDSDGYPTTIANSGVYAIAFIPSQANRSGNYVITWDGTGTIYVAGSNTLVSGSKTSSGGAGAGRYVFSTTDSTLNVGIASIGSPAITNMKFFHVDDEAAINAGNVFGVKFKERLAAANFGVYRFLNWQEANTSFLTTWASRKPTTYYSWGCEEMRSSLYAGATTNSGDDYAVTLGSGAPVDKQTILLKFNASKTHAKTTITYNIPASRINWTAHGLSVNDPVGFGNDGGFSGIPGGISQGGNYYVITVVDANTLEVSATLGGASVTLSGSASGTNFGNRQPTLNLNGTGAVPIKNAGGSTLGTGDSPLISTYGALVYDAGLGSWLKRGGDTSFGSLFLNNGIPPEIALQLCVEMGAHPWFVIPYIAADTATDWATGLATYLKANAPAWMIPRFEGPNELWNFAQQGVNFAVNKAYSYGWGADYHNWMGKVMSVLGQAVNAVYTGSVDATKYHVICGVQTVAFDGGSVNATWAPRLTSAKYVIDGGSAASNWTTHVTPATYFRDTYTNTQRGQAALDYEAADAAGKLVIATDFVNSTLTDSGGSQYQQGVTRLLTTWANIKMWANNLGVSRMTAYEGGWSPDYVTGSVGGATSTQINTLYAATKAVADLDTILTTAYDGFVSAGGAFPSCFQFAGTGNVWSVLDPTIYATPDPPQWTAIATFNMS